MAISTDGTELLYDAGSSGPQADLIVVEIEDVRSGAAE
jgi:hypothetical protein